MKLIFLGTGSAFTVGDNNFHSNILVEDKNKNRLLIDCGTDIRLSLYAYGLAHYDISDVYISHLHADHAGGLEWLAFNSKFNSTNKEKIKLHISDKLVKILWENVLSGGLKSLKGEKANLTSFFEVEPVHKNFHWQNIDFELVPTVHVYNDTELNPSFGLMFKLGSKQCLITTDTQFTPQQFNDYYLKADIIFHDCETNKSISGVHSHYTQLVSLPPEIKAKMWLYHYNPGSLPDAVADGFLGFVKPGQCFDFE